ncbi:MAG: MFS transporter [bacterium]
MKPQKSANDKALFTIFLVVLIDLLGFGIILPLLPYIAEQYSASPLQIGLLAASYSFFQFIAGPILGRLSDRYGRKKLLVISQFGSVLGYIMLGLANSLPLLFLSRIIDGITGGNISIAQAYVADVTTKENRAKAMGMIGAAFGLGFMLGPAIGGYLSRFGYFVPAYFAAAIGLVTTFMTAFVLKETVNLRDAAKNPKSALTLERFREVFQIHPMGLLIVVYFLVNLGFSVMQGVYALWSQKQFGWGPTQVGSLFAFIGIMSIIAQLKILPWFLKNFGERMSLKMALPLMAIGFLLIPISTIFGGLAVHLLANVFISLGNSLSNPTITAIASENVPKEEYGGTLGILQSAASVGRIGGPILGGWLFTMLGVDSPFVVSAILFVVATYMVVTQLEHTRPSSGK